MGGVKHGARQKMSLEFSKGQRCMMSAMCGEQLKDRRRCEDLMLMLCLNKALDQLAMVSSARWYCLLLSKEDGHVMSRSVSYGEQCSLVCSSVEKGGRSCHESVS